MSTPGNGHIMTSGHVPAVHTFLSYAVFLFLLSFRCFFSILLDKTSEDALVVLSFAFLGRRGRRHATVAEDSTHGKGDLTQPKHKEKCRSALNIVVTVRVNALAGRQSWLWLDDQRVQASAHADDTTYIGGQFVDKLGLFEGIGCR